MSGARWTLAMLVVLALGAAWLGLRGARRDERRTAAVPEPMGEARPETPEELQPAGLDAASTAEVATGRTAVADEALAPVQEAHLALRIVAKETGAALAGIRVVLRLRESSWSLTASGSHGHAGDTLATDAEGRVEYEAEPDQPYVLDAGGGDEPRAAAIRQDVAAFAPGERRELVVELATALDLVWFGRVLDGETNQPLAGARARRVAHDPDLGHASTEPPDETAVVSGADGLVRLDAATWDTSSARVESPGYAPVLVVIEPGHEGPSASFTVLLYRAGTLEVLASDAAGAPRADLAVRLSCEAWDLVQGSAWKAGLTKAPPWEGRTDARGRCVLADLPARVSMTLELRDGTALVRRDERSVRLEPGEQKTLRYMLGSGCQVLGRTLDGDGRPAAGVEVWLVSHGSWLYLEEREGENLVAKATSDDEGRFVLDDVGAGRWRIGPAPRPRARRVLASLDDPQSIAPVAQELVIAPEQMLANVTLTCWSGLYIGGRVVGPDGEKVQGHFVSAQGAGLTVTDGLQGEEFQLGPLPSGAFTVRASGMFGAFADAEPVTVPAGTSDLVLRMRRGGGVDVTVLDSRGNPASGVLVWVLNEVTPEDAIGTNTNEAGKIHLGGRLPGAYTTSAASSEGEFACASGVQVGSDGGDAEVELHLEPAARLRIRVLPELPAGVDCLILRDGRQIGFALLGGDPLVVVPEGELELVLLHWGPPPQDELQRRTVRAVLGGETEVVFDLSPR